MIRSSRRGFMRSAAGVVLVASGLDKLLACGDDVPTNLPPLPSVTDVVDAGDEPSLEEQPSLAEEVDYTDPQNHWFYTHTMENNGEEGGAYAQPFPGNIGAASYQSIRTSNTTRMSWDQLLNEYHGVAGETAVALEDGTTLGDKLRELYTPLVLQVFPAIQAMYDAAVASAVSGTEGPADAASDPSTEAPLIPPEQVAAAHLDALLTNLPKHDRFLYFGRIALHEQDPETGEARQVAYMALPFMHNGNPTYGLVVDGFAVQKSLGQSVSPLQGVEQVVAAAEYVNTQADVFGGE